MAEMSLMESLARGLRGAGGVLSPRVYEDIAASDRQEAALRQQVQMKLYEQKIRDEREKALGEAVRPALESGNLDQAAAAAAATPGGFQTGMTLLGQAEARKARAETLKTQLEQRAQDLQMRHEQRLQELQQRGADARALALERQDFQRQMLQFQQQGQQSLARLTASLRPERQPQIVTNTEGTFERQPDGTWKQAVGGDGKPLPGKPKTADQRQVLQLGRDLDKAKLTEIDAVLGAAEDALAKTPEAKNYIGGVGSIAPDLILPKEVTDARQAFQKLFNITLKNRSGAAVTVPEFERLKAEFANGLWKKPEQVTEGLAQARNIINKHYAGIVAGYGPDALKSYNENLRGVGGRVVIEPQNSGTSGEWGIKEKK